MLTKIGYNSHYLALLFISASLTTTFKFCMHMTQLAFPHDPVSTTLTGSFISVIQASKSNSGNVIVNGQDL